MKIRFYKILKYVLLVVSCGFYNLPVAGFENPAHPRPLEEAIWEQEEFERKTNPGYMMADEEEKEQIEKNDLKYV